MVRRTAALLVFTVLALIVPFAHVLGQSVPQTNPALERRIVGEINDWRVNMGLAPLAPNAVLQQMAQDQARYLMTTNIPQNGGDFHRDGQGRYPQQRATQSPYNWPTYGHPDTVIVGENAAVGTVDSALNFWHNSSLHAQTIQNANFREIGVAALDGVGDDTLFVAVFGGRPNTLPVLFNPARNVLYMTGDPSRYAAQTTDNIRMPITYQFLDENGSALGTPQIFQTNVVLPQELGDRFSVRFSDGRMEIDTPVEIGKAVAVSTQYDSQLVYAGAPAAATERVSSGEIRAVSGVSEIDAAILANYPNQDVSAAAALLSEINTFRLENEAWPLRASTTLQALALQHADYLINQTDLDDNDNLHVNAANEGLEIQAQVEPFAWPTFGPEQAPLIGDTIAIGDVDFAMRFWRQSLRDRATLLNNEYREVGIAALPAPAGGNVLVVVYGSRPNVVPISYLPDQHMLLLSNETNTYGGGEEQVIGTIQQVMIFDENGAPLTDGWIDWSPAIELPEGITTTHLFIVCTDGLRFVHVQVDLEGQSLDLSRNVAVLPEGAQGG